MTAPERQGTGRPEWRKPGMSAEDAAVWEAAERAAAAAPELRPGDEPWERLRPLLAGWLAPPPVEERGAA